MPEVRIVFIDNPLWVNLLCQSCRRRPRCTCKLYVLGNYFKHSKAATIIWLSIVLALHIILIICVISTLLCCYPHMLWSAGLPTSASLAWN